MTAIPAQAHCKRCTHLFVYFRVRRPRFYCAPCVRRERHDANEFNNMLARCWRLMEQKVSGATTIPSERAIRPWNMKPSVAP